MNIPVNKNTILIFGSISYVLFFISFLYAIGFMSNEIVPKSIDSGTVSGLTASIIINLVLLGLFAAQHSIMARPQFKKWWHNYVPESAERSVYVLASSLLLFLLYWLWQPMPEMVWKFENEFFRTVLWGLYGVGWAVVLISTFLINHFDLFGLRQVYLNFKDQEYTPLEFKTPVFYKYVRHPLYVGWFLCFWFTPDMSQGHLLFAVTTSIYILIAIQLEEKDMIHFLGDVYVEYREKVPMLVPFTKK